jgi:hypothetical protein
MLGHHRNRSGIVWHDELQNGLSKSNGHFVGTEYESILLICPAKSACAILENDMGIL